MQKQPVSVRIEFIMVHETNPSLVLSYNTDEPDGDRLIVAEAQQGSIEAFERLVIKHQKRMLNIAFRMLGDYEEACECVQDVFLSAYRNINGFRGEARFSTWLTSITLNHARNRLKQMKAQSGRIAYSLDEGVETEDGNLRADPPAHEPSALDRLQERELKNVVRFCIESLDLKYREVIVLRDLQDFSYEEIGACLGIRTGTVKSRLFRAREAVGKCLKKAWGSL